MGINTSRASPHAGLLEIGLQAHGAPGEAVSRDRDTGTGEPPSMCLWRKYAQKWARSGDYPVLKFTAERIPQTNTSEV